MNMHAAIVPDETASGTGTACWRMGEMLAAAIRQGGLLTADDWPAWIDGVQHGVTLCGALVSVELSRPDAPHRRWFADPLTALLIVRWHDQRLMLSPGTAPALCLALYHGRRDGWSPDPYRAAWAFRLPGLIHAFATGRVPAASVPLKTWERIACGIALTPAIAEPKPGATRQAPLDIVTIDLKQENDVLSGAKRHRRYRQGRAAARTEKAGAARDLAALPSVQGNHAVLRDWAIHALGHGNGRATKGYAVSTTKEYLNALNGVFAGWTDCLLNGSSDALTQWVQSWIAARPSTDQAKPVNALGSFEDFLNSRRRDTIPINFRPVERTNDHSRSANLILPDAFVRARSMLMRAGEADLGDLLTLMFRTGLRLDEACALRAGDVAIAGHRMELLVEENHARVLKTKTSRRIVPLDVLLEPDELTALRRRVRLRGKRDDIGEAWLFGPAHAIAPLAEGTVRGRLQPVLRAATQDESITCSHLRHSFASYLLATLLLPQDVADPEIPPSLTSVISPVRFRRVVDRLLGAERLGAGGLHAVSQLMGHTGPQMTLRYYCHLLDFSLGLYCRRPGTLPPIERAWLLETLGVSADAARKAEVRAHVSHDEAPGDGSPRRPDAAATCVATPSMPRRIGEAQLLRAGFRRSARHLSRSQDQRANNAKRFAIAEAEPNPRVRPKRDPAYRVPWRAMLAQQPNDLTGSLRGKPWSPELARFIDQRLTLTRAPRLDERRALAYVVQRFANGRTDIRLRRLRDAVAFARLLGAMGFKPLEIVLSLTSRRGIDLSSRVIHRFLIDRSAAPRLAGRNGWHGSLCVRIQPEHAKNPVLMMRACRFALRALARTQDSAASVLNAA